MRTKRRINLLAVGLGAVTMSASVMGQGNAVNEFNAESSTPATYSFGDQNNWQAPGGPGSWGVNGNEVNGSLQFNMNNGGAAGNQITINEIFGTYTGISEISTVGGNVNSSLTLSGPGLLSMSSSTGEVRIVPTVDLILDVNISAQGNLILDTSQLTPGDEILAFTSDLIMSDPGAILRIQGAGNTLFTSGSTIAMNGTLIVGENDNDSAVLNLEGGVDLIGDIALIVNQNAVLNLGGGLATTYEFGSLNGSGRILAADGDIVNFVLNGGTISNFNGYFNLEDDNSNLTVTGAGTRLTLGAGWNPDGSYPGLPPNIGTNFINGTLNVLDGGFVLITPIFEPGSGLNLTTLSSTLFIDGGTFGGEGTVELQFDFPDPNFVINSGWLLGGNQLGTGTLSFGGSITTPSFGDDAGIMVYYNPENPNVDEFGDAVPYIEFTSIALASFLPGANIFINILNPENQGWISDETELLLMENNSGFADTFVDATGGDWDAFTNMVTRSVEIFTDTGEEDFNQLIARITANYAAPAGDLAGLGSYLNSLIPDARQDPFGAQADLLAAIDENAFSLASYQNTLATGLLPQSQFAAERATADNMYSNVARRNIREVAIGTRGPGMLKADAMSSPMLLASLQEQGAVQGSSSNSPPQVIINGSPIDPNPKKQNSDVFQTLFVDGYGQWTRMNQIGNVVGYDASTYGVATGWGIALSDGLTLGLTAGWENTSVTLNQDLGDATVNSFRGTPFISWSGTDGTLEQYAILSIGGGYNTADGVQRSSLTGLIPEANYNLTGWEFDFDGTVGTRIPLTESFALQPEASIRYSLLEYTGNLDEPGIPDADYKGGDFNFFIGRIGTNVEWLVAPSLRLSAGVGYQGQAIDYGTAQFEIPGAPGGASQTIRESGGNGTLNQIYTGVQLLWAPSWNTSFSVSYDGAFGDGEQNALTGGFLIRF